METWNPVERAVEDAVDFLEGKPGVHGQNRARRGPFQQRVDFVEERDARRDLCATRNTIPTVYQ